MASRLHSVARGRKLCHPLHNYPSGGRKRLGGLESGKENRWTLRSLTGSAGTLGRVPLFKGGGAPLPLQKYPLEGQTRRSGQESGTETC